MTKSKFLIELASRIRDLSQEEAEQSLSFWSEAIDDRMEEGLSEEAAVAAMGSPDDIAREILLSQPISRLISRRSRRFSLSGMRLFWVLFLCSPLLISAVAVVFSLLISAYAIIFSLLICAYAGIFSLYVSYLSVLVSFGAGFIGGIGGFAISLVSGNVVGGLALLGGGLVCGGLFLLTLLPFRTLWRVSIRLYVTLWRVSIRLSYLLLRFCKLCIIGKGARA
jgi:uncharacterized membrane protein